MGLARRSLRPSRFVSVATGGIFLASRWRCTWVIRNERRAVESLGRGREILWPTAHVYSFLSSVWHRDSSRRAILTRQRHCVCVLTRRLPLYYVPWNDGNDDRPWSCVISGTPWDHAPLDRVSSIPSGWKGMKSMDGIKPVSTFNSASWGIDRSK